ncbi:MAG: hypothetical protein ACWA41_11590 [Putridiphycobacter sp.]
MKTIGVLLGGVALTVGLLSINQKSEKKFDITDKYKVIKVNGKIFFQKTKTEMQTGDYFVQGTPVSFATQQSRAAIINKQKGRFVLKPATNGKVKILPAANNVSSRAGALINLIDIQNHFSGDYLVLGKMELEISEEAFPQNESNFFYLSYDYNGELIRKKLSSNGNKLILDKNEIFKVDGNPIPVEKKEMALYYREGSTSKKISEFSPVFPDEKELKTEIEIILSEFQNKDNAGKKEEVTAYVNEFYGKPQKENLGAWLEKEFDIK